MFSLNEEELQRLSYEVKSLQSKLLNIESFANKVRARSKLSNPIENDDRNTFEKNLDLILLIKNTTSFKEKCIQYLLNNLFKPNISFIDILNDDNNKIELYSKQQREIKISSALITQIVIKTHPNFPYSVANIIVSFIQIDHEIAECKKNLKVNDDVQLLFTKMRQNKDFSLQLYEMFIRVDRKLFVPEHEKEDCNSYDRPISLNYGVSLSAPHIHVHALKQFEYLLKQNNDGRDAIKFLDVGCGTGYIATLMAVGFVLNNTNESYFKSFGCIYNPHLLNQALIARNILNLNSFLQFKHASIDMNDIGWKENSPFDGIYCGAAIKENDCILLREQLKVGGYLMCVVEHPDSAAKQIMKLIKRVKKTDITQEEEEEEKINEEEEIINGANEDEKEIEIETKSKEPLASTQLNTYLKSSEYGSVEKNDIISLLLKLQQQFENDTINESNNDHDGNLDDNEDDNEDDNDNVDDNDNDNKESDESDDSDDNDEDEKKEEMDSNEITADGLKKLNSIDSDFEITELFDVRFRTLRGRFQYLRKEKSLLSDSEDDSD